MKILFLALNVNIKGTVGDAVHVRELVSNLANLGNEVSLIGEYNLKSDTELLTLKKNKKINIYFNKVFKYNLRIFTDIWNCLKIVHETYPDIIYARCFSCKIGFFLSIIIRRPLIIEVNGISDDEAKILGTYKSHRFSNKIREKFTQIFFKYAKKIVAVTPGIKDELIKRYRIVPDKIVVIPNGANTEIFKPMDQEAMKRTLGFDISKKYVCFVGNLAPWQGIEYLVKAAPPVIKAAPQTRFLIVGDGMMCGSLKKSVKENHLEKYFYFTGKVPYKDVPKYINSSDICVAPFILARNEKIGLSPLKIYEYMACGKPVIGSNINGVGDFLKRSNAGISFNAEKAVELADALIRLLADDDMRDNMGRNGMNIVNEQFSWNKTSKSIIGLCEKAKNSMRV